jgi:hypothetical protein
MRCWLAFLALVAGLGSGGCVMVVGDVTKAVSAAVEQGTRDAVPLSLACAYYHDAKGELPASFSDLRAFILEASRAPNSKLPSLAGLSRELARFPDLAVVERSADSITFAYQDAPTAEVQALSRITVHITPNP